MAEAAAAAGANVSSLDLAYSLSRCQGLVADQARAGQASVVEPARGILTR